MADEATPVYSGNVVPTYTETNVEADADSYRSADEAVAALKNAMRTRKIRNELDEDLRIFVSPLEPNTTFLVKPGKMLSFPDPNSPRGKKDMEREGDVWAEFHSGICATRDDEVIEWCEAHSGDADLHTLYHSKMAEDGTKRVSARECGVDVGLCRDIDWPATPGWAELKSLQMPTARRGASLPATMDVDKLFARIPAGVSLGTGADGGVSDTISKAGVAARAADRQRTRGR